jgi:uncharacterized protein YeaO (DUF488 family)
MQEYQQIAAWVKEQHAEDYLLTWLLTQPQLWWCEGELYQAAISKDGERLKAFVEAHQESELLVQIADKLTEDDTWEIVAVFLNQICDFYQELLAKLPEVRPKRERIPRRGLESQNFAIEAWAREESDADRHSDSDAIA